MPSFRTTVAWADPYCTVHPAPDVIGACGVPPRQTRSRADKNQVRLIYYFGIYIKQTVRGFEDNTEAEASLGMSASISPGKAAFAVSRFVLACPYELTCKPERVQHLKPLSACVTSERESFRSIQFIVKLVSVITPKRRPGLYWRESFPRRKLQV